MAVNKEMDQAIVATLEALAAVTKMVVGIMEIVTEEYPQHRERTVALAQEASTSVKSAMLLLP